jgi:hypothetical protein
MENYLTKPPNQTEPGIEDNKEKYSGDKGKECPAILLPGNAYAKVIDPAEPKL